MDICGSCGRDVADDAGFCEYCGAATAHPQPGVDPGAAAQGLAVDYWVCRRCHVENDVGGAYCVACGAAMPAATSAASLPATGAGPQPPASGPARSRRAQRRWPIAVVGIAAVAVIAVAAVVFIHGIGGTGHVAPSPRADVATGAPGGGTPSAQASPSPSPSGGGDQAGTKTSWKGIGARLATPFWGAFYCAGSNKRKAIEAAQVGQDAGFSTLVL